MKIEIKLRNILREYTNLDKHGLEQMIARECHLNRHPVGKLLHNDLEYLSLDVLGKICRWLIAKGVPKGILPGALLGASIPSLWEAIIGSRNVTLYLGEYGHVQTKTQPAPGNSSIARCDAAVASKWIQTISLLAGSGNIPTVSQAYVPFRFNPHDPEVTGPQFEAETRRALAMFAAMRDRGPHDSVILLGSQRVNYLIECLVADLFSCQAFVRPTRQPRVPFFHTYRDFDRPVPSCFGSRRNPPGIRGPVKCGTWYHDAAEGWTVIEWKEAEQDAGVVLVIQDGDSVALAVFGFSGATTTALGDELIDHPELFWTSGEETPPVAVATPGAVAAPTAPSPATEPTRRGHRGKRKAAPDTSDFVRWRNRKIGAFICKVKFRRNGDGDGNGTDQTLWTDKIEVVPIARPVLLGYLRRQFD